MSDETKQVLLDLFQQAGYKVKRIEDTFVVDLEEKIKQDIEDNDDGME